MIKSIPPLHRSASQRGAACDAFSRRACCFCASRRASDRRVTSDINTQLRQVSVISPRCFPAGFTWSYNSQLYHDTYYPTFDIGLYLFFTSIIGGSIGILIGGVVSDKIVKKVGIQARAWVLAVSQVICSKSRVLAAI